MKNYYVMKLRCPIN